MGIGTKLTDIFHAVPYCRTGPKTGGTDIDRISAVVDCSDTTRQILGRGQ